MPEHSTPRKPGPVDAAFYGGTGLAGGFVFAMAIGLSIIGYHVSADSRAEREQAQASEAAGEELDVGAQLFARRCASCHGAKGEGGLGPSFVDIVERIPNAGDQEAVVREGRSTMPAFGNVLSDQQIALVVAYEREILNGG